MQTSPRTRLKTRAEPVSKCARTAAINLGENCVKAQQNHVSIYLSSISIYPSTCESIIYICPSIYIYQIIYLSIYPFSSFRLIWASIPHSLKPPNSVLHSLFRSVAFLFPGFLMLCSYKRWTHPTCLYPEKESSSSTPLEGMLRRKRAA